MSKYLLSMALGLVVLAGFSRGVQAQNSGHRNNDPSDIHLLEGGDDTSPPAPVQPPSPEPTHPFTQPTPQPSIQPFSGANQTPDTTPPTPVERPDPPDWEFPSPQPAMFLPPSHAGGSDTEIAEPAQHVWEVWLTPRGERYWLPTVDEAEDKADQLEAQLPGLQCTVEDLGHGRGANLILRGNPILFRGDLRSHEEAVRVVRALSTRLPNTKAVIWDHD